jgi:hypothetical protein
MKQTNIPEKAIQKAIDGGWELPSDDYMFSDDSTFAVFYLHTNKDGNKTYMGLTPSDVIFNHDFAKALWGEDEHTASPGLDDYGAEKCESCGYEAEQVQPYCWHHHLMRMVIADDPIKYLGENL